MYLANNIFCLEGDWNDDLRKKTSILSGLEMLHSISDVNYIHKTVGTFEELKFRLIDYINNSIKPRSKYKSYDLLYIATHGRNGSIYFDNEIDVLDLFEEIIHEIGIVKPFAGKVIHFGSCLTMKMSDHKLKKLAELTGAFIISGYTKSISFLESTLFDVLYFNELITRKKKMPLISYLDQKYAGFKTDLGFKFF